jgi:hypothetical protein
MLTNMELSSRSLTGLPGESIPDFLRILLIIPKSKHYNNQLTNFH